MVSKAATSSKSKACFCDGRYGSGHRLNGKCWGGKRSQVALPPCISEVQSMLNAGTLQVVPLGAVQEGIDAARGLGGERGSFLDVLKISQNYSDSLRRSLGQTVCEFSHDIQDLQPRPGMGLLGHGRQMGYFD